MRMTVVKWDSSSSFSFLLFGLFFFSFPSEEREMTEGNLASLARSVVPLLLSSPRLLLLVEEKREFQYLPFSTVTGAASALPRCPLSFSHPFSLDVSWAIPKATRSLIKRDVRTSLREGIPGIKSRSSRCFRIL